MPHSTTASLNYWPPWPQFNAMKGENKPDNVTYKRNIVEKYGAEAVRRSWIETCKALERVTAEIEAKKTEIIPVLTLEEILNASVEKKEELKNIGCFVVRGVVPRDETTKWFWDLKGYVEENRASITGFPDPSPYMFNVYHSPTQQAARSHSNSLAVQRAILNFWHDKNDASNSFAEPLSYADAFRIRAPKTDGVFTLPPHIDGGSLSRWADSTYSATYSAIFSGKPAEHDPYDLTIRKYAKSALFPGTASSVLRAFQGWTALTESGPREGSLILYPDVKVATAYMLLRPFFEPPENKEDLMDAEKWKLSTENEWFPGTYTARPQMLSPNCHPHLRLEQCLVDIPRMYPGDTIWWHADMIHAVEPKHEGDADSAVMYIAATPSTPENVRYMKQQFQDFRNGVPPEDFKQGTDETKFKGYLGEVGILNGEDGKKAAGFYL